MFGYVPKVIGYVDVLFTALSYEFKQRCWVTTVFLPVEIQLGNDRACTYKVAYGNGVGTGNVILHKADVKKDRELQDTYVAL